VDDLQKKLFHVYFHSLLIWWLLSGSTAHEN